MASDGLGLWMPLDLKEVVGLFEQFPARWWVGGGHALELHLGRSWRIHNDIDVGILRNDAPAISDVLPSWDVEIASSGVLTPWKGSTLLAEASQNNLWCRKGPEQPWCLDITIGEGDREFWIFRRDPTIRIPWPEAVLRSDQEVPYLAPDLQLLFKSKDPRPKDDLDAIKVIPELTSVERSRLHRFLPEDHPWQALVG